MVSALIFKILWNVQTVPSERSQKFAENRDQAMININDHELIFPNERIILILDIYVVSFLIFFCQFTKICW